MEDQNTPCVLIHLPIGNDRELYNCDITCPFCKKISDLNSSIQVDDYVEVPMLWCDNCGATAFLKVSDDFDFDCLDNISHLNKNPLYIEEYSIPLVKVLEVVDICLVDYISSTKLTPIEINEILSGKKRNILNDYIVNKYNLRREDEYRENKDLNLMFNMSLPVYSYNVYSPKKEYPINIDLSHDGVCVYCKLENNKIVAYWGD